MPAADGASHAKLEPEKPVVQAAKSNGVTVATPPEPSAKPRRRLIDVAAVIDRALHAAGLK
jgi:hypothetical protein